MTKNIIVLLLAVAIALGVGVYLGTSFVSPNGTGQMAKILPSQNNYQAGWDAAKKRLADSGTIPMMGNLEIKNISGEVTVVKGNSITLKIRPLEPLADPSLDERIVQVDNNTKITILAQKDQKEYQSEMAEFQKKMQEQMKNPPALVQVPTSPASAIMPPELFVKKEASLSDIKVGATLNVIATDKDIKNTKQFSATEIGIQPTLMMAPPAGAPLSTPGAVTPPPATSIPAPAAVIPPTTATAPLLAPAAVTLPPAGQPVK